MLSAPSIHGQSARVDELFARWNRADSPGCAVGVIRDGQLIHRGGYGMASLDHGVPLTTETVFYIASTSKQFTAMSIARLVTEGRIGLDDDIRRYLPELPQWEHRVTVRHLVHHTSGIPDFFSLMPLAGRRLEDTAADDDIIALLARQPRLNFKPGDHFQYSNSGYFLLGVIVSRVTGRSLRQFAEESFFIPLGMRQTHFHDDRTMIVPKRATGYVPKGEGFAIFATLFDRVGDGGLMTTIEDLVRWDRNFYEAKAGGRAMIDLALTPGRLNDGTPLDYGFGLFVREYRGLRQVSHGGIYNGFRAELLRFPDQRLSVACLCNLYNIDAGRLAQSVADLYLASAYTRPAPATEMPLPPPLAAGEADRLAGTYFASEIGVTVTLRLRDGRLVAEIPGGGVLPQTLAPYGPGRFRGLSSLRSEFDFSPAAGSDEAALRVRLSPGVGQPVFAFRRANPVTATSLHLTDYAGNYYSRSLDVTYELLIRDGALNLRYPNNPPKPLAPTVQDVFSAGGLNLIFTRDERRRITRFRLSDLSGRVRNVNFERR